MMEIVGLFLVILLIFAIIGFVAIASGWIVLAIVTSIYRKIGGIGRKGLARPEDKDNENNVKYEEDKKDQKSSPWKT